MKLVRVLQISSLVAGLLAAGTAGWSKFGINKTRVTFPMPHPPAFYTPGREIRVEVSAGDPNATPVSTDLQRMLEQALREAGFKPLATAQTVLEVTVCDAESRVGEQRRIESVNVHTGTHTETDKKGKTKEVEDCKSQDSRVTYLVSTGRLLMTFQATDAGSQTLLAPDNIEHTYQMESAISGPRRCGGTEYHLKEDQITDSYAILRALAAQAIPRIVQQTAGYDEPLTVMLAVDDELKPGNAEALAGNWQGAFDVWRQANLTRQETEAARQYNLGVAHEALAGLAMRNTSLDEAARHLDDAEACYRKALQLDEGEKYFRDSPARVESDREILRLNQEYDAANHAGEPGESPAAASEPALSFPVDGWPEGENQATHDFRAYVRQRMLARGTAKLDENLRQKLVADANDYQVNPGLAARVVDSEAARLQVLNQNVMKYQELLRELAGDGVISKDERAILETRRKTLHLSAVEARQAESGFHFREE